MHLGVLYVCLCLCLLSVGVCVIAELLEEGQTSRCPYRPPSHGPPPTAGTPPLNSRISFCAFSICFLASSLCLEVSQDGGLVWWRTAINLPAAAGDVWIEVTLYVCQTLQ